jgi:Spy/CpxP family protein refolding chaperone
MKRRFIPLQATLLVGALGVAISAFGQTQNQASDNALPRRQFGPGAAGRFSQGFEQVLSVLTDEQRASMREAMVADREKIRDLEQKIRESRKELFELGLREKFDEAAVREKAAEAAKLDTEMTILRVKAISKIRPPLTAEQIEKIKNSSGPEMGDSQPEPPRRRHDILRDENGLPLKDQSAPQNSGSEKE